MSCECGHHHHGHGPAIGAPRGCYARGQGHMPLGPRLAWGDLGPSSSARDRVCAWEPRPRQARGGHVGGFRRMFAKREGRIAWLEECLVALQAEAHAVREYLADLRAESGLAEPQQDD